MLRFAASHPDLAEAIAEGRGNVSAFFNYDHRDELSPLDQSYTASDDKRPLFDGTRFTDPALYDFNASLFADPTPQNLGEAYGRGVRWLVAERLPGLTVSPRLDTLADKRYDNGTVAIYELRRP